VERNHFDQNPGKEQTREKPQELDSHEIKTHRRAERRLEGGDRRKAALLKTKIT
jgi:hypothetical protein